MAPAAANRKSPSEAGVRVRVLLFAGLRELEGRADLRLEVADGARVADVVKALEKECRNLSGRPFATALNRRYAGPEAVVADGDELALIPPVSGG